MASVTRKWRIACCCVTLTWSVCFVLTSVLSITKETIRTPHKRSQHWPHTVCVHLNDTLPSVHRDANVTAFPDNVVTSRGVPRRSPTDKFLHNAKKCATSDPIQKTLSMVALQWSASLSCLDCSPPHLCDVGIRELLRPHDALLMLRFICSRSGEHGEARRAACQLRRRKPNT